MEKHIFDFENGDFAFTVSDNVAMDSDENLMMRMGDNMAMDMDSGDIYLVCSLLINAYLRHLEIL